MIDVLLLGTGAMVPLPERYLSAALLRVGADLHLIDCGEGTQVAMRQHGWGFKKLKTILLTHFHADHVAGLPGLMHTLAHSGKIDRLTIVGPAGTYQVVSGLFVIVGSLPFEVVIQELSDGDSIDLNDKIHVTTAEGEHRSTVLSYRFDLDRAPAFLPDVAESLGVPRNLWSELKRGQATRFGEQVVTPDQVTSGPRQGVSLGFVTDTRPVANICDLVKGVDLLISEATYGDDVDASKAMQRGHMTFREAAELAHNADAGALWLTHFGAGLLNPEAYVANAKDAFENTTAGFDGLQGTIAYETGYRQVSICTR